MQLADHVLFRKKWKTDWIAKGEHVRVWCVGDNMGIVG